MEFDRHDRMKSILIELIATFVREEANPNPLITVTNLSISSNYHDATVFFTTIPNEGEGDALVFLKRKGSELREYLKKHARLKHIPNIDFEIDRGERHRQHIDEVAQELGKKREK